VTDPAADARPRAIRFRSPRLRLSLGHIIAAGLLFAVEVLIALAVDDDFVRPYVGDVLVVVLIHSSILAVADLPPAPTAVGVFGFACAVEAAQYAGVGDLVADHPILRVVVGTTFQWGDIVAYGAGAVLAVLAERAWRPTGGGRPSATALVGRIGK
jgi:hypothetical protein